MNGSRLALDTTVAIHYLNGLSPYVQWVPTFHVFLPIAAAGELMYGAMNSHRPTQNLARYTQFIDACHVIDANRDIAFEYARLRLELKRAGTPIPENDI